jgi:hypothetical protein
LPLIEAAGLGPVIARTFFWRSRGRKSLAIPLQIGGKLLNGTGPAGQSCDERVTFSGEPCLRDMQRGKLSQDGDVGGDLVRLCLA